MPRQKTIRILIAEDDFLVAKEIQRILNHTGGYEIVGIANNGEKTVEMVCTLRPDILLLDIQMPRMDGLEVAKRIQKICPTPIVVLTAYESEDFLEKASDAGVGAYLTKPPDSILMQRAIIISIARHQDLMKVSQLCDELREQKETLEKNLAEIKTLRGILPICASCKKIRDDNGYWKQVETYIREHSDAEFTHGICPECMRALYPDYENGFLKEDDTGAKTKRVYIGKKKNSES